MADSVTRQLERSTDLIYRGLEGIKDRKAREKATARQEKLDAERLEEKEYRRGREAKLDEARAPALEVARRQSAAEIEAQDSPITLARIAPTGEMFDWATYTPGKGKRDPKQGEQRAVYQKFGDIFESHLDTKKGSETEGKYVHKKTGKLLTQKDVMGRQDEVLAMWIANRGHGRSYRAGMERNDKDLMMGNIDEAAHAKRASEIQSKANDPSLRIRVLDDEISFLKKFNTKDAKAGLARKQKRRDAMWASIKKNKPTGGKWKYNSDMEAYVNDETMEMRPVRVKKTLDKNIVDKIKIGDRYWSNAELRKTYETIFLTGIGKSSAVIQRMLDSGDRKQIDEANAIVNKIKAQRPFDEWVGNAMKAGKIYAPEYQKEKRMGTEGGTTTSGTGQTSYKSIYTR